MECHFDFNKKTISKILGEFLSENLPNEAEHIKRLMSGKKLQYMEANQVLRSVLTALTASNSHVTEEIVMVPQEEEVTHEGEALKADGVKDHAALIPVTKSQPPIKEKDDKKSEDPMSNKDICHFYTINNV